MSTTSPIVRLSNMKILRPVSTTEALVGTLREEILAGELAPGARLPEEALAGRFGVARPTARAAVQTLVFEGLLRRERNRTAYVPKLTADDIHDLFLVRIAIEVEAIRIIIERGVRPDAAEAALERLEDDQGGRSWTQVVDDALAFHRGLIEAVESPRLARAFGALQAEWALCFAQVKQARGGLPANRVVEHREIFDAIVDGDAEHATHLMREHLQGGARLSVEGE